MTSFLPLELNDIGFMPQKKKGILCAWNVPAMFIKSGKLFLGKKNNTACGMACKHIKQAKSLTVKCM